MRFKIQCFVLCRFFFGSLAVRGCMPNTFYLHRLKLHAQSMDEYFYDFSSHVSKLYVFRFPFTFATTFVWNNVGLNGCCLNVNKYVFFCLFIQLLLMLADLIFNICICFIWQPIPIYNILYRICLHPTNIVNVKIYKGRWMYVCYCIM